jgi:hypothetical protein
VENPLPTDAGRLKIQIVPAALQNQCVMFDNRSSFER